MRATTAPQQFINNPQAYVKVVKVMQCPTIYTHVYIHCTTVMYIHAMYILYMYVLLILRSSLVLPPREFARTIPRPFSVRYNPYTQSVEVVKDKMSLEKVLNDIRYDLDIVQDAVGKVS